MQVPVYSVPKHLKSWWGAHRYQFDDTKTDANRPVPQYGGICSDRRYRVLAELGEWDIGVCTAITDIAEQKSN
jgi:hypothetical protein